MNGTASKKRELSKRSKQPSTYRRIVTAIVDGKSIVQSDEQLQAYQFKSVPNYEQTLVWGKPDNRQQVVHAAKHQGARGGFHACDQGQGIAISKPPLRPADRAWARPNPYS